MDSQQARKIIELVQQARLAEAFEELRKLGINMPELYNLEREFINGLYRYDIYERVQVCINRQARTSYAVIEPTIDIFFAYSSKNEHEATQHVMALRRAGLCVFFSADALQEEAGQSYFGKIQESLEKSEHFVLFWTAEAQQSEWVRLEYETFFNQIHLPDKDRRRFFVIGDTNIQNSPAFLRNIQTTDIEQVIQSITTPQRARTALEEEANRKAQEAKMHREEEEFYEEICRVDTIRAYEIYLGTYPQGRFRKKAGAAIKRAGRERKMGVLLPWTWISTFISVLIGILIGVLVKSGGGEQREPEAVSKLSDCEKKVEQLKRVLNIHVHVIRLMELDYDYKYKWGVTNDSLSHLLNYVYDNFDNSTRLEDIQKKIEKAARQSGRMPDWGVK